MKKTFVPIFLTSIMLYASSCSKHEPDESLVNQIRLSKSYQSLKQKSANLQGNKQGAVVANSSTTQSSGSNLLFPDRKNFFKQVILSNPGDTAAIYASLRHNNVEEKRVLRALSQLVQNGTSVALPDGTPNPSFIEQGTAIINNSSLHPLIKQEFLERNLILNPEMEMLQLEVYREMYMLYEQFPDLRKNKELRKMILSEL